MNLTRAKLVVSAFKACVLFETMESDEAQEELVPLEETISVLSYGGQLLLSNFEFPLDHGSLLTNLAHCWARGMVWDSLPVHQLLTGARVIEVVACALQEDPEIKHWLLNDVAKFEFPRLRDVARWAATNVANGMYVGARMPKNWASLEDEKKLEIPGGSSWTG